jgi:hypothetical protein
MMDNAQYSELLGAVRRIEGNLNALIQALALENSVDEQPAALTLDGQPAGGERDPNQTL